MQAYLRDKGLGAMLNQQGGEFVDIYKNMATGGGEFFTNDEEQRACMMLLFHRGEGGWTDLHTRSLSDVPDAAKHVVKSGGVENAINGVVGDFNSSMWGTWKDAVTGGCLERYRNMRRADGSWDESKESDFGKAMNVIMLNPDTSATKLAQDVGKEFIKQAGRDIANHLKDH